MDCLSRIWPPQAGVSFSKWQLTLLQLLRFGVAVWGQAEVYLWYAPARYAPVRLLYGVMTDGDDPLILEESLILKSLYLEWLAE
jgi:hypothetical protein